MYDYFRSFTTPYCRFRLNLGNAEDMKKVAFSSTPAALVLFHGVSVRLLTYVNRVFLMNRVLGTEAYFVLS